MMVETKFSSIESERRALMKNVVGISVGFAGLFTAYGGMAKLQSSINQVNRHRRLI